MYIQLHKSIFDIPERQWSALTMPSDLFLSYSFLAGLEKHGCVGAEIGWQPLHLSVRSAADQLVAVMPLYLKFNSFGEFVFDWSWAQAYEQQGLAYYPKLVSAIPFTPAQGRRILIAPEVNSTKLIACVSEFLVNWCKQQRVQSAHILFAAKEQVQMFAQNQWMIRFGCQFHWYNREYRDFQDYLSCFTASKRKKIKRERRRIHEAGIEHHWIPGHEAKAEHWSKMYRFYGNTFRQYGNYPALTESFFHYLGHHMGEQVVLMFAQHKHEVIAGSLCFRSDTHLYGRYWGCSRQLADLHFETCYYQGLEYCIQNQLEVFEPGAQGEHKVPRGFEPQLTYSAHYLLEPQFRQAVADFLEHEQQHVKLYQQQMRQQLPFKVDQTQTSAEAI